MCGPVGRRDGPIGIWTLELRVVAVCRWPEVTDCVLLLILHIRYFVFFDIGRLLKGVNVKVFLVA